MIRWGSLVAVMVWALVGACPAGELSFSAALETIRSEDTRRHVDILADDSFEGREAGSRGGRAAGNYLQRLFAEYGLQPAGDGKTYFQLFDGGYRNILGFWPGEDGNDVIVVGAHYDHVGYGNRTNSFGPFGYVHNGADDNASGTAALLEIAQAMTQMQRRPKHSVLFVLWDGEEKGLLGSKYWVEHPTIDLNRIRMYVNLDMVGRLRDQGIEVYGTRTLPNLRQMVSRANAATGLPIDFRWEMTNNSDHYTFFSRSIPSLMIHTGLHDEYHRPQDDAHLINHAGIEAVARLCASLVWTEANRDAVGEFRGQSRREAEGDRQRFETTINRSRSRLGIRWNPAEQSDGAGLKVSGVTSGKPAAQAGIQVGDRIVRFAGLPFTTVDEFVAQVQAAEHDVVVEVIREGHEQPISLAVRLDLDPAPIGISWRMDSAEPAAVMLTHVTPGSVAALAGLAPYDRIYEVNGQTFGSSREFRDQITRFAEPTKLLVERRGQLREVTLPLDIIRPLLNQTSETANSRTDAEDY